MAGTNSLGTYSAISTQAQSVAGSRRPIRLAAPAPTWPPCAASSRTWRLDLLDTEAYLRARDLEPIQGQALPRGRALSAGEQRALFNEAAHDDRAIARRDAALLALLTGAGLRRSELAGLQLEDLDMESGQVIVRRGKGRKDRITWLPPLGTAGDHGLAACAWRRARAAALPGAQRWPAGAARDVEPSDQGRLPPACAPGCPLPLLPPRLPADLCWRPARRRC